MDLLRRFFAGLIQSGSLEVRRARDHSFSVGDGTGEKLAIRFNDRSAETLFVGWQFGVRLRVERSQKLAIWPSRLVWQLT